MSVTLQPGEPQLNRLLRLMKMVDASDLHLSANVVAMVRKDGEIEPLERRVLPGDVEGVERFTLVPARATVQVSALPKGARVEIDAVAYKG